LSLFFYKIKKIGGIFIEWILTELVGSGVQSSSNIIDQLWADLASIAFYVEKSIGAGVNFADLYTVFFSFSVVLIVVKFLKKGFDIYVGWDAGDPDADPLGLVVNFLRALITAIGFPVLYNLLVNVTEDILLKALTVSTLLIAEKSMADVIWDTVKSLGLTMVVLSLILIITYIVLYFQFIKRGIEILIMRIGAPLACVGLVDSDKGVFTPFMKKFFLNATTVLTQILLVKLSFLVLSVRGGVTGIIFGIAIAMTAVSTPKFLSEFMLIHGGGGSVTNTIYHVSRLVQMTKAAIKKTP